MKDLMEIPKATTSEKASGRPARRTLGHTVFSRELALAALTIFTIIIFWILYPTSFANFRNFSAILRNLAFEGILAIGMMIMLVGGNFDLSVGSMASMIGVVTGALMKMWNWPVPLAVATGLSVAALGGFINGFIVAKVRVNALITTLGTMGIFDVNNSVVPSAYVGGFGSWHPSGANFLFCDGSLHFLKQTIDAEVFRRLGHRADGELIDGEQY